MAEKISSPIYDFYQSLANEKRGTMSRFAIWVCGRTGKSMASFNNYIKRDLWSPVEREEIMAAIADGRWRQ